jgi:hypothetical protein
VRVAAQRDSVLSHPTANGRISTASVIADGWRASECLDDIGRMPHQAERG